ncbi:MAG: phosphoglycerate mutase [Gammaproteobacteria bacterium]|jgi:2,3-bisphosphoglycerate-independent phosphoglycerate mutase|nr:phosphoglycerate mutase [Gammaproteobacteria bacterium]
MTTQPRPLALIILDGWGYREETRANAIALANTPHWDQLWQHYPHTFISASGHAVGLPDGQMGNSEVGHLNIGAGRIVSQDLTRIEYAISDNSFFENPILTQAIDHAVNAQKAIHILGLLSPGGIHSHEQQIQALVKLAAKRQATQVYIHAFLDGRDTPPRSAESYLTAMMHYCQDLQCGEIVSIIGRYYAMDRDQRWQRTQEAYDLLTLGKAHYQATDPITALHLAYARGENDEFVKATRIQKDKSASLTINEGDTVIFMNFRADRARQLTQAFIDKHFNGFTRMHFPQVHFSTLTEYDSTFQLPIAFPTEPLPRILGECLSQYGLRQLRIAETEKYAHVTFFFNGGLEKPYPGEDRILIPSPSIATYDLQPEMNAPELTAHLIQAIQKQTYDVIICNFANADMVGHSGNLSATIKAIEALDTCLGEIIDALHSVGGEALITADHGNAEMMFDEHTQQPHTAHTHQLVPLIYAGHKAPIIKPNGLLSDIAPTMLYLLDIPKPAEMTGESLLNSSDTLA